jgi:putative flippase GtrA
VRLPAALTNEKARKGFRFVLLSGLSFALNYGLTVGLHEYAGFAPDVAFAIALAAVFVVNFFVMRFYVYRATAASLRSQLPRYVVSAILFRIVQQRLFAWIHMHDWLPYKVNVVVVLALFTIVKFFFWDRVVFKSPNRVEMPT